MITIAAIINLPRTAALNVVTTPKINVITDVTNTMIIGDNTRINRILNNFMLVPPYENISLRVSYKELHRKRKTERLCIHKALQSL